MPEYGPNAERSGAAVKIIRRKYYGKGYAYTDVRNVLSSLSEEAGKAFLDEYCEFDPSYPWFSAGDYGVDCEFKDDGKIDLLIHYCPSRYGQSEGSETAKTETN